MKLLGGQSACFHSCNTVPEKISVKMQRHLVAHIYRAHCAPCFVCIQGSLQGMIDRKLPCTLSWLSPSTPHFLKLHVFQGILGMATSRLSRQWANIRQPAAWRMVHWRGEGLSIVDVGVVASGCHFSQLDMVASEVFLMLRDSWQWVSPHNDGFQKHLCDIIRSCLITWQGQNWETWNQVFLWTQTKTTQQMT